MDQSFQPIRSKPIGKLFHKTVQVLDGGMCCFQPIRSKPIGKRIVVILKAALRSWGFQPIRSKPIGKLCTPLEVTAGCEVCFQPIRSKPIGKPVLNPEDYGRKSNVSNQSDRSQSVSRSQKLLQLFPQQGFQLIRSKPIGKRGMVGVVGGAVGTVSN